MSLAAETYMQEQMLLIQEVQWIQRILEQSGVPTGESQGEQTRDGFVSVLYQFMEESVSEETRKKVVYGSGDCLRWGVERVEDSSFARNNISARIIEEGRDPESKAPPRAKRLVQFTLTHGWRPDINFMVYGFVLDGEVRWALCMSRHAQIHNRVSGERQINKPFGLKNNHPRRITREDAEKAIVHLVSTFLPGYRVR